MLKNSVLLQMQQHQCFHSIIFMQDGVPSEIGLSTTVYLVTF